MLETVHLNTGQLDRETGEFISILKWDNSILERDNSILKWDNLPGFMAWLCDETGTIETTIGTIEKQDYNRDNSFIVPEIIKIDYIFSKN